MPVQFCTPHSTNKSRLKVQGDNFPVSCYLNFLPDRESFQVLMWDEAENLDEFYMRHHGIPFSCCSIDNSWERRKLFFVNEKFWQKLFSADYTCKVVLRRFEFILSSWKFFSFVKIEFFFFFFHGETHHHNPIDIVTIWQWKLDKTFIQALLNCSICRIFTYLRIPHRKKRKTFYDESKPKSFKHLKFSILSLITQSNWISRRNSNCTWTRAEMRDKN